MRKSEKEMLISNETFKLIFKENISINVRIKIINKVSRRLNCKVLNIIDGIL